jgi:hypothetical protein
MSAEYVRYSGAYINLKVYGGESHFQCDYYQYVTGHLKNSYRGLQLSSAPQLFTASLGFRGYRLRASPFSGAQRHYDLNAIRGRGRFPDTHLILSSSHNFSISAY